jgi:hypothetical protein
MCAKTLFFRSFCIAMKPEFATYQNHQFVMDFDKYTFKKTLMALGASNISSSTDDPFVASMFVICLLDPIFPFLKKIGSCQYAEFDAGGASNQVRHCCNGFAPMKFLSIFTNPTITCTNSG